MQATPQQLERILNRFKNGFFSFNSADVEIALGIIYQAIDNHLLYEPLVIDYGEICRIHLAVDPLADEPDLPFTEEEKRLLLKALDYCPDEESLPYKTMVEKETQIENKIPNVLEQVPPVPELDLRNLRSENYFDVEIEGFELIGSNVSSESAFFVPMQIVTTTGSFRTWTKEEQAQLFQACFDAEDCANGNQESDDLFDYITHRKGTDPKKKWLDSLDDAYHLKDLFEHPMFKEQKPHPTERGKMKLKLSYDGKEMCIVVTRFKTKGYDHCEFEFEWEFENNNYQNGILPKEVQWIRYYQVIKKMVFRKNTYRKRKKHKSMFQTHDDSPG
jgi:hypothetical protein